MLGRRLAGGLVAAFLCAGCAIGGGASQTSSSSAHFSIKVASLDPAGTTQELATESFLSDMKKKSGGRLSGQIFLNGQLGSSAAMVKSVEQGTVQMNYADPSFLSGPVPQMGALNLPFLFPSVSTGMKVVDGPIGKSLNDDLMKSAGVRILGWFYVGGKSFETKNHPVHSLSDLKDEKFRVSASPTAFAAYKSWGAIPVDLDGSEITVALRQGAIDGIDLTLDSLWQYKFYESVKYATESNHQLALTPLFINEKFYESLPSDLKKVVKDAATAAVQKQRTQAANRLATVKKELTEAGIQISPLDPSLRKQLHQLAQPAYDMASSSYGPRFVNDLVSAAEK